MQDYVAKLGREQATLEQFSKLMAPLQHTRKALCAKTTKECAFDKLSRNVLQNVMTFFDYKGTDFMKMRGINRKSKSSYMQELKRRFNADRSFKSLPEAYLVQCTEGLL